MLDRWSGDLLINPFERILDVLDGRNQLSRMAAVGQEVADSLRV